MKYTKLIALLLSISLLASCGSGSYGNDSTQPSAVSSGEDVSTQETKAEGTAVPASSDTAEADSGMFTSRDYEIGYDDEECIQITLSGDSAQCDDDSVSTSGSTVQITAGGTYLLSGSLDGMILVETADTEKVQLILDGTTIHSASSAAIYIRQADKVFLTTAADSENILSNGGEYTAIDDNQIDSVIFSKSDLTLNGEGDLTIEAPMGHGIVSKDDLAITSGTYHITAGSHGLSGKDSIRIANGAFILSTGKDGIHAENTDDASLGFIYISGGTFQIVSESDGISASGELQASGGTFAITAGGGSSAVQSDQTEESVSLKGLKSSGNMLLSGGSFQIDAADDALHTNGELLLTDGNYQICTGDDGAHADGNLTISGGTVHITQSYEGLEGQSIDLTGGEIQIVSSDDGLNAAGGSDQSGTGGFGPMDSFASDETAYLHISGGSLTISAEGDGLDSNGTLTISGGSTYVDGPSTGGNSSLDFNGEGMITGGILVTAGSAEMAQNLSVAENQGVIMASVGTQEAGSLVELTDSAGNVLLTYRPEKSYACVIISCPEILQGNSYTLAAGSTTSEIVMDSLVYGTGSPTVMGGPGGMNGMDSPGGMNGMGSPGGMSPPAG